MATHRPLAGRRLSRRLRTTFQEIARNLKPATYTAFHRGTVEQPVFVGGLPVMRPDGAQRTTTVPVVRPEQHPVNHFRRLKRAWLRRGPDGFYAYMQSVGADSLLPQA